MARVDRFPQLNSRRRESLQDRAWPTVQSLEAMTTEGALGAIGASGWRVGHYFESLVGHWLQQLPGWTLIACNAPVRLQKQTLGAYDFIVRNAEGEVEHWEVAVKFYLRRDAALEWRSWVGPNQRDRLDKKVNRMRDHQLVLSRREVGLQALQELGVTEIHHRNALLKGCFFTEWGSSSAGPQDSLHDAQGRWIDVSRVGDLTRTYPDSCWTRRDKPFWLAPMSSRGVSIESMVLPTHLKRPEMWSRMAQTSPGSWSEAERWFFVPEHWSNRR